MDKPIATIAIKGERTNCISGKVFEVTCTLGLFAPSQPDRDPVVYVLDGGSTGHESFYLNEGANRTLRNGWCACFGTEGRWDKLVFSAFEMTIALDHFIACLGATK